MSNLYQIPAPQVYLVFVHDMTESGIPFMDRRGEVIARTANEAVRAAINLNLIQKETELMQTEVRRVEGEQTK